MKFLLALLLGCIAVAAEPKRVLFLTHSAGFRHDSIAAAAESLRTLAPERFEVVHKEDLSYLTASRLKDFHAVFFFTSGELAIDDGQKTDLLEFIRDGGGGFAGAHSATDTLYLWPEYGDLIGGYFDGHPWVGDTNIDIEDPEHPAVRGLGNAFRILDEIYRFRDFSRDRSRVLMTLRSSIGEPGVNKLEYPLDSPLAWCRNYGKGRVFYTALGHFDETWRDPRIRAMLLRVLEWLTGEVPGDGSPRAPAAPRIARVVEPAQQGYPGLIAPGAVVSIHGENLTTGSTMTAGGEGPALRLAGTWAWLGNGQPARLLYASPERLDVLIPENATGDETELWIAAGAAENRARVPVQIVPTIPGIHDVAVETAQISIVTTVRNARVSIDGADLAEVIAVYPVRTGVWEIVVPRPASLTPGEHTMTVEAAGGRTASRQFQVN